MANAKTTISIGSQRDYSPEQLHTELSQLRRYILDLGRCSEAGTEASELCDRIAVLNWLVDDVTFSQQ